MRLDVAFVFATLMLPLSVSLVRADDYPDEAGAVPDPHLRLELALSPSIGFVTADDQSHGAEGVHVHGGVELSRFALLGEIELFHLDATTPCLMCMPTPESGAGHETRMGLDARFNLVETRARHKSRHGRGRYERFDVWVDGGVGRETITVGDVGARSRADYGFGAGLSLTNRTYGNSFGLRLRLEFAPPFSALPAHQPSDATFMIGLVFGLGT